MRAVGKLTRWRARFVLLLAVLAVWGAKAEEDDVLRLGGDGVARRPLFEVDARFRLGALPLDRLVSLDVTVRNTGRAASRPALIEVHRPVRGFAGSGGPPLATAHIGPLAPGASVRRTLEIDVRGLRPGTACFPVSVRVPLRTLDGDEEDGGPRIGIDRGGLGRTLACVDLRPRPEDVVGGSGPIAADESVIEVRSVTALGTGERAFTDLPAVEESGLRLQVRIEARRVRGGPVPPLEVEVVETPQAGGAPRVVARYRTAPLMVAGGWDERAVAVTPGGLGPRCYAVRVRPAPGVRVLPRAEPACVLVEPSVATLPGGLMLAVVPRGADPRGLRPGAVRGRVRAGEPVALELLAENRGADRSPALTVPVSSRVGAMLLAGGAVEDEIVHVALPALAPGERRRVPFEFRFTVGGEARCVIPLVQRGGDGLDRLALVPLACYEVEGPTPAGASEGSGRLDCPLGAPPSVCFEPALSYRLHDGAVVDALRLAVRPLGVEPAGRVRYRVRAEIRVWTTGADPVEGVTLEVLAPRPHGDLLLRRGLDRAVRPREAARAVTLSFEVPADRMGCLRVRAFGRIRTAGRELPARTGSRELCVRPRLTVQPGVIDPVRAYEAVRRMQPRIERVRLAGRRVTDQGMQYGRVRIRVALPERVDDSVWNRKLQIGVRGRDGRVRLVMDYPIRGLAGRSRRVQAGRVEGEVRLARSDAITYGECALVRFEGRPWPAAGRRNDPRAACLPEPPHYFVTVAMRDFSYSPVERSEVGEVRPCMEVGSAGRGTTVCAGRLFRVRRGGGWARVPHSARYMPRAMVAVPPGQDLELRLFLQAPDGRVLFERSERVGGWPMTWKRRYRYARISYAFVWSVVDVRIPSDAARESPALRLRPGTITLDPETLRRAIGSGR